MHALAVYPHVQQRVPSLWTARAAADLHGAFLSEGFVRTAVDRAAAALAPFQERVVALVQQAEVAHGDESGIRVAGRLHWLHVACTAQLTWYHAHRKRGHEAMRTAEVLPFFTGTLVSDAFTCYQRYDTHHALRNTHILRDLEGVHHADPARHAWAQAATDALTNANQAAHAARQADHATLADSDIIQPRDRVV